MKYHDFYLAVLGDASFLAGVFDVLNNCEFPTLSSCRFSIQLNLNMTFHVHFFFRCQPGRSENSSIVDPIPVSLTELLADVSLLFTVYDHHENHHDYVVTFLIN
jgi:hypothetical protein